MSKILAFTSGPDNWQALLSDPVKHWRSGYSARTLAYCWLAADGFPPEVAQALSQSGSPSLADLTPVLAVPEFKVPLPGGVRPSQNDIFVLARSAAGPVSIMIEGKVNESFGPTIHGWISQPSPGRQERLRFLMRSLGLRSNPQGDIRYQLLHRAASAIITGEQYRAVAAVLVVHSFSKAMVGEAPGGWPDYQSFARLFGVDAVQGKAQSLSRRSSIPLFGTWVVGDQSFLKS
jgi:hypothetical protein